MREFLTACEAVASFDGNGEVITFNYDAAKIPTEVPEGIYLDLSQPAF